MANIASQKKRILRSERERTENRLLTSTVKTHFRRLESAVEAGDAETVAAEQRDLVSKIDKAVQKGALHKNTGARKKSKAARIAAGAACLSRSCRRAPQRQRQRQLVAVVGAAAAPELEVGQRLRRHPQARQVGVAQAPDQLLGRVGVHLQRRLDLLGGIPSSSWAAAAQAPRRREARP